MCARWPEEGSAPEMAYSDGDCSHTLHAALPWSPTDVPVPSARRRCTIYREGCYKLQAVISIRPRQCLGNARTCNRRRLSRRKPASAGGTRARRMHDVRNVQLAGSPAVVNRPAEAALCLQSSVRIWTRVYHPNMAALARTSLRTQQALTNMRPMPG
jgi:hypothetical protein